MCACVIHKSFLGNSSTSYRFEFSRIGICRTGCLKTVGGAHTSIVKTMHLVGLTLGDWRPQGVGLTPGDWRLQGVGLTLGDWRPQGVGLTPGD